MTKLIQPNDQFNRNCYYDGFQWVEHPRIRLAFEEQIAQVPKKHPHSEEFVTRARALFERYPSYDLCDQQGRYGAATQLFIATAMGCVRYVERLTLKGIGDLPSCVHAELFRWYRLQAKPGFARDPDPVILKALSGTPYFGKPSDDVHDEPQALTWVAPVALFLKPDAAFAAANQIATFIYGGTQAPLTANFAADVSSYLRGTSPSSSYLFLCTDDHPSVSLCREALDERACLLEENLVLSNLFEHR